MAGCTTLLIVKVFIKTSMDPISDRYDHKLPTPSVPFDLMPFCIFPSELTKNPSSLGYGLKLPTAR